MTAPQLLLRNLTYHWRGNLAVMLGVAVGTAVLTGDLLVGDSVRGSLREQRLRQLGWVQQALVSWRFIREQLSDRLKAEHVAPVIMVQGTASLSRSESESVKTSRRVGRVMILGVDARFWGP